MWQSFIKSPSIKFHGHPSNGSRTDTFGRTDGRTDGRIGGQTGNKKLLGAFCDYEKAPKFFLYGNKHLRHVEIFVVKFPVTEY